MPSKRTEHQTTFHVSDLYPFPIHCAFSFSDPCLAGASEDSKDSGNGPTNTTNRSPHPTAKNESTKMMSTILEQIGALQDTNTKICRSLHENRGESYWLFSVVVDDAAGERASESVFGIRKPDVSDVCRHSGMLIFVVHNSIQCWR